MALVSVLAVAKRPEGDLATYVALVEKVHGCSTLKCVLGAGDTIQSDVLRDPAFSVLLIPFMGNARVAIAVFAIVIYATLTGAALRVARHANVTISLASSAFVFSAALALVPVTLSTHLLRQCLATSCFMFALTTQSRRVTALIAVPLLLVHRGATAIASLAGLLAPWIVGPAILLTIIYPGLVPADVVNYATREQRTGTSSIYLAIVTFGAVLVWIRKRDVRMSRVLANALLILLALLPLGESLVVTRTFTSCLMLSLPALVLASLSLAQRMEQMSREVVLWFCAAGLIGVSIYRDSISPFSYDFSRLWS